MIKLGTSDMAKAYVGSSEVSKMYLGNDLVWSATELPFGYTKVEYILSVPLGTYIDTGYIPNINTEFEIEYQQDYLSTNYPTLYGTRNSGSGTQRFYMHTMPTLIAINVGDTTKEINTAWSDKHYLRVTKEGVELDGTTYSYGSTVTDINPTTPMLLFGYRTTAVKPAFCGRIYSCQIKESGILLHKYIPCINPNGIYGMYDVVSDSFLGSANNSYVFSGPPLSITETIPSEYEKCSWIQNPSIAYIDTGYVPNQDYTVSTEIERTTSSGYQFICSSDSPYAFCVNNSNKLSTIVNNKWNASGSIDLNIKYLVEMTNKGNAYVNKTKTITATNNATATNTLKLFIWNHEPDSTATSDRGFMKMYNFRLHGSNGALLCDYQPVRRKSDGEYGMWDFVTNTFLTSPNGISFNGE